MNKKLVAISPKSPKKREAFMNETCMNELIKYGFRLTSSDLNKHLEDGIKKK